MNFASAGNYKKLLHKSQKLAKDWHEILTISAMERI